MATYVLFLLEKDEHQTSSQGSVFAYFPSEPDFDCYGNKPSYAHVGQHSGCCVDYAVSCSYASPRDYNRLLSELRSIGYQIQA